MADITLDEGRRKSSVATVCQRLGNVVEIDVSDKDTRWYVLHTRSRQEKAVARTLTASGIDHYLPLTKRPRYRRGRRLFVEEPLLRSYLFLHGSLEATYVATATKRVANVITVADQECFAGELRQIRCALENGADLSPSRYLTVGRRVRVSAGPFRGIEGLIEVSAKADRLVLQIDASGAPRAWRSTPAFLIRWT